jgi:DNA-binding response OmpR family regulator
VENIRLMRLLLIEDDHMLSRGIRAALSKSGYAVDIAGSGGDAMRVARTSSFDAGILDLGLPDVDGMELLQQLRLEGVAFPILILSARDGLNDRVAGLDAGADDYLIKPFALSELQARLRALLRRREENVPWFQLGRLRVDSMGKRAFVENAEIDLTRREFTVLEILIRRAGRVVSKEALFDAVFHDDFEVAPNALEVHVSRLRCKLRPAGVGIRALRGLGYRIEQGAGDDGAVR